MSLHPNVTFGHMEYNDRFPLLHGALRRSNHYLNHPAKIAKTLNCLVLTL
jgi:hypothetical protein